MGEFTSLENRLNKNNLIQYGSKKRNVFIAYILGWAFGPFGLFYTSWKTALIWLLGVPGVAIGLAIVLSLSGKPEVAQPLILIGIILPWIASGFANGINARRINKRRLLALLKTQNDL